LSLGLKKNTGYLHNTAFGVGGTRIIGGKFSLPANGSAAVGVDVQGDHLLVHGTAFLNLTGAAYGLALPKAIYSDVKILSVPSISSPNIFLPGANLMGVQVDPPQVARMSPARIRFSKTVPSGTVTDLLRISSFAQFGRFRLTLTAFAGNGFQTKQFDFGVTANTIVGGADPIVTPLSTFSNANWQLALGALQFSASGTDLIVRISATAAGVLGNGQSPTILGDLEVLNYEPAPGTMTGAIKIL
jgi:hypothetical protein